jgi:5-methylthioribose kinase
MGIFDKEYLVYAVILPMINKTRMEKDLKPVKVPKCFYSEVDPGILIMENLKKADFKLIKSKEYGMDEGELTLFLEALAEFHAAMYHVMTTIEGDKATFLEKYPTLWGLNEMNPAIKGMFKESQQAVTDTIAKIAKEYFGQDVHDRMVAWKLNSFDIWYNTFLKPVGKFTTIVHGDAWANNAMFMYVINF